MSLGFSVSIYTQYLCKPLRKSIDFVGGGYCINFVTKKVK